jgi:hypothetical protein
MSPEQILNTIILGVSSWTLLAVISLKTELASLRQKVRDLPCRTCGKDHDTDRITRL